MKARATIIISLFLPLLALVLFARTGTAAGGSLEKKVAGTYVDQGEFFGDVIVFNGTRTLNADGTLTSTNSNCCGAAGTLQSIGLGNWQKTGKRQITSTSIIFVQDPTAAEPTVARVTLVEDFDKKFETSMGTISTDIFFLNQDDDMNGILDYLEPGGVGSVLGFLIPGTFVSTRVPIIL